MNKYKKLRRSYRVDVEARGDLGRKKKHVDNNVMVQ